MRSRLLNAAGIMFVIGCLSVAYSSGATSVPGLAGIIAVVLALVAAVAGLWQPKDAVYTVDLNESEQQVFREVRDDQGPVPAIRRLRQAHPRLGLVEAKRLVETL